MATSTPQSVQQMPHEGLEEFQHTPLAGERSIRILKLFPRCEHAGLNWHGIDVDERTSCEQPCCSVFNNHTLPPRFELEEYSRDTDINYEAMSYCWGDPTMNHRVLCGSRLMNVTRSCWDLLSRVQRKCTYRTSASACSVKPRHIWIDAICIDQTSKTERNQQVSMMADIYQGASCVLVWPGDIGSHGKDVKAHITGGVDISYNTPQDLNRVLDLINKPYFTRVWPVQEVALARACRVLLGTEYEVDIRAFLTFEQRPGLGGGGILMNDVSVDMVYRARRTFEQKLQITRELWMHFQRGLSEAPRPPRMSQILLQVRHLEATEHRDKIFALQGILDKLGIKLPGPDYRKPVDEVFTEATYEAMIKDRSLRVLGGLTGYSRYRLPSWAPDWSDSKAISEIRYREPSQASGSSSIRFQTDRDRRLLRVKGMPIDEIGREHVRFDETEVLEQSDNLSKQLNRLFQGFEESNTSQIELYASWLAILIRKVWLGHPGSTHRMDRNVNGHITMWLFVIKRWMESSVIDLGEKIRNLVSESLSEHSERYGRGGERYYTLHTTLCRVLDRKTLSKTKENRLALASLHVEEGDVVILLQGFESPMAIRPGENNWRLIAPVYMHGDGIMEGKLWDTEKLQDYTFE